jgi:hypothetical protein
MKKALGERALCKLTSKEGTLHYMEAAYFLVFIRNRANLAHFFRQIQMRQKWRNNLKFPTVRPVKGPSFDSAFAEK